MELRAYQQECLASLTERYREGRRRVLVSLPTGTGKTVIFAHFPRFFRMKKRLLVLAHRKELLEQAREKFQACNPGLQVEIEQASHQASQDSKVVIASVPSLGRARSKRLARLNPDDFYLLVVDEAHHAVAPSYRRILDHFGMFEPNTPRMLVGFTATPGRGDGKGLASVFQEIAFKRRLEDMIREGYLCKISGWRVSSSVDLDGVRVRAGDFVESQLAQAVDVEDRNALLIRAYNELCPGRRCIVFCVNVAHAQEVARGFCAQGLRAAAVWGAMPDEDRRATLARFSRGDLEIVTNCNVLTEGFDEPAVDCIIMARPTHSKLLYAQMVGRGTRLHTGKEDLQVIDVADNTREHSLAGLHTLFDLPEGLDLKGSGAQQMADRLKQVAEKHPWIDTHRIRSPEDLEFLAERADLFRLEPPDEIKPYTCFTWCGTADGGYALQLPNREALMIRQDLLDRHTVSLRTHSRAGKEAPLGVFEDLAGALRMADGFVHKNRKDVVKVVDVSASWRKRPASNIQRTLLADKGIALPGSLTRGQAAWMIGMLMARASVPSPL